jgi:beta-N-acetylhexosaminidase
MEGGRPFDPDDLDFDFASSRRRRLERDTGERRVEGGPEEPPSNEYDEAPSEEEPYDLSRETGDTSYETGERPYDTGASPYDTGERRQGTGEYDTGEDPFDTGERRRRREQESRRGGLLGGLKLGRRRSRDRRERPAASTETGERRLEDDPYTPAEVAVSQSRRERRRDLPAKVRRRQAGLIGLAAVLVLAVIVIAASAIFGGGDDDESQPLPLKKLAGQTIIGKVGKADPNQQLLRRVRKGLIGGFIFTSPRDEATLAAQAATLQQAAADGGNPPLLMMIDQEGGEVKRLDGPPNTDPQDMGEAGADTARTEGEETGNFLRPTGINVDLAPVLDVEVPGTTANSIADRTFSDDAAVVSEVGSAFIQGLQSAGVAATAKHFPGLGPATLSTDDSPVTIAARDETLEAALLPFQTAVDAGVELVMVSSAVYEDYGPENPRDPNRPASSVGAIVQNLLRDQLGFQGVCVTDDLQSVAIETLTTPEVAGVAALGAGCDLLLYAGNLGGSEDGLNAVVRAVKRKKLSESQLQASYDRIQSLKSRLPSASSEQ